MKKNDLTPAQKTIFNAAPNGKWFSKFDHSVFAHFRNIDSQLRKIADKGFLEKKYVLDKDFPDNFLMGETYYKKIPRVNP
jgi:hypothetical protein